MKKIFFVAAVFLTAGLLGAQTLDDVLAKYYQAHGGLDKLKAVTAIKMSGKLVIPAQGLELPMVRWQKAPDKLRVETLIQDKKIIQAFDGRRAWWINPLLAAGAQEMPQEQAGCSGSRPSSPTRWSCSGKRATRWNSWARKTWKGSRRSS